MKKIILLLLIFSNLGVLAQKREKIKGNKEVLIKTFKLENFSSIEVGDRFHVALQEATDAPKIKIETDDNLFDVIRYDVDGEVLRITSSKEIVKYKRLNITVYFPKDFKMIKIFEKARIGSEDELNISVLKIEAADRSKLSLKLKKITSLDVHGTGKSELKIETKCDNFDINLSESAHLEGELFGDEMNINLGEHAVFSMKGSLSTAKINTKNKSRYAAAKLKISSADVKAYDKSDVIVNIGENISLESSGNSEIYIYGTPQIDLKKFKDNAIIYKK